MKKPILMAVAISLIVSMWLIACNKSDNNAPIQSSLAYAPGDMVAGKSIAAWTIDWWRWAYSLSCTNSAFIDPTGAHQMLNQSGSVFYLAGTVGDTQTRSVTIPSGKNILIPIINYQADYPCPDTSFHPAAGETLEHFLTQITKANIDIADIRTFTIDGIDFTDLASYRAASGMFTFTGDISLKSCADPCVTGSAQQAASDGYWIMLKPLSAGNHKIHLTGGITSVGFRTDVTYNLTIQ
jgi:hypothetical protein